MPMSDSEWKRLLKSMGNQQKLQSVNDVRKMRKRVAGMRAKIKAAMVDWDVLAAQGDKTGLMMTQHLKRMEERLGRIVGDTSGLVTGDLQSTWQTWWKMGSEHTQGAAKASGIALTQLALESNKLDLYEAYIPNMIKDITSDTTRKMASIVRNAALAGESRAVVNKKLMRVLLGEPGRHASKFGGFAYQAERIYRTESQRLYNMASHEAAIALKKQTGADLVKIWNHTGQTALSRPNHVAMDKQVRELDEPFSNGLKYPKDPAGSAAETINCKCFLTHLPREVAEAMGYNVKGSTATKRRKPVPKARKLKTLRPRKAPAPVTPERPFTYTGPPVPPGGFKTVKEGEAWAKANGFEFINTVEAEIAMKKKDLLARFPNAWDEFPEAEFDKNWKAALRGTRPTAAQSKEHMTSIARQIEAGNVGTDVPVVVRRYAKWSKANPEKASWAGFYDSSEGLHPIHMLPQDEKITGWNARSHSQADINTRWTIDSWQDKAIKKPRPGGIDADVSPAQYLEQAHELFEDDVGGTIVHEYGHHQTMTLHPEALVRAKEVIRTQDSTWIRDLVSRYATTNEEELLAEAYTIRWSPQWDVWTNEEAKALILHLLDGSPMP